MIVGDDVRISPTAIIKRPELVRIGDHVAIDDYTVFTTSLELESYIHISPFVSCIGGALGQLQMGNFTTISAGCRIICRSDEYLGEGLISPIIPEKYRDRVIGETVVMDDFSAISTNVILFPNVWLAEGVVVGAGSVVTQPITVPWTIWMGTPARIVKSRPKENMIEYAKRLGYE